MTGLLASVRDLSEARIALAGGADIIDMKEPAHGALGAVAPATISAVIEWIAQRRPVSATVGDLPMQPDTLARAVAHTANLGVDYVKVGLLATDAAPSCIAALGWVAARTKLVAVLFADQPLNLDLIDLLARARFAGVMLDTAHKRAGNLLAHLSLGELQDFVARAKARALLCGLAGSLRADDVPVLLPLGADYLGFRGALCLRGERTRALSAARIAALRARMGANSARLGRAQAA